MSLNLNLNLKKPLVFLKVATTGMEPVNKKGRPADRIIEISITKIDTDRTVKTGTRLINPGIPIPSESSKLNGITDEMVANMPSFSEIASNLFSFIGDADFAGFNLIRFDLKFLTEEFNRANIEFTVHGRKIIDLSSIYNQMERRDFRAALKKFTGKNLTDAPISSETANIEAINILNGMIKTYSEDERFKNPNPTSLNDNFNRNSKALDVQGNIILNNDGRPVFRGGKYKGKLIGEMMISDPGYYDWYVNASDMPSDTKIIIKKIVEKAKAAQVSQNA